MRRFVAATTVACILSFCPSVHAIHRGANDLPYSQSMDHPLDAPLNKAFDGKCFFMNLGPTGIRARIDPEEPRQFKVQYVFQDAKSPARGLLKKGDMIIGANGKVFRDPHGFHRKKGGRGWVGPPYELALAIEDSQGEDGKLELLVYPTESPKTRKTVVLQLKPVGRFSETYPWDCPRSDQLLEDLCDFMIDNGIGGRHHYQIQQLLALWAADEKRVMRLVEDKAEALMRRPPQYTSGGMVTWGWGYTGIFLGEYYNETKDRGVKDVAEALAECFEYGQDWRSGGYSHRPFPAIEQRVAGGGPKGYGSMAGPGGLAMLAQSIFKATGLPYSQRAYYRTHQGYLQTAGASSSASIAYGFSGWPDTLIRLRSPDSPSKSKEGIGYLCPTGMADIGDFEVENWFQKNGSWKMELVSPKGYAWMEKEAGQLSVFETARYVKDGSRQRSVVRPLELKEPTRPYDTTPGGGGHVAPMGMGAVAHLIGHNDDESWGYLGRHLAAGCALSPKMMFDGHADATMHSFFSVLGAARADEEQFRSYLDYAKTWIVLAESHDGQGLIDQPFGCQRNATASISRNRTAYTHTAILLLSIPKRRLLITGADAAEPATVARARPRLQRAYPVPVTPMLREARTLSREKRAALQAALLRTLVKLDDKGELLPVPVALSVTDERVWLAEVDILDGLTFQRMDGAVRATFDMNELSGGDQLTLAMLIAHLKPESGDAQALVGVYFEALGRVKEADEAFESAGSESRAKVAPLFDTP